VCLFNAAFGTHRCAVSLPDLAEIQRAWDAVAAADAAFDRGDHETAIRLYAVLTGDGSRFAYGSYRVGLAHLRNGEPPSARHWFHKAAELGHPLAMVELARLAAAAEPDEARSWLLRAAEAGYRDAQAVTREPRFRHLLAAINARPELVQHMEPAQHEETRRQLDFWVGDWDVRAADGRPAGRNRIRSLLGGALIHEDWQSAVGWRGQSINFVNTERRSWEQVWVQDDGSHTHYTRGRFRQGALRFLTGTRSSSRRLSFHPLPNGWVRQVGEGRSPDGSWLVEYDLIYTPRK
jgi:hypothetical protein